MVGTGTLVNGKKIEGTDKREPRIVIEVIKLKAIRINPILTSNLEPFINVRIEVPIDGLEPLRI